MFLLVGCCVNGCCFGLRVSLGLRAGRMELMFLEHWRGVWIVCALFCLWVSVVKDLLFRGVCVGWGICLRLVSCYF